MPLLETGAPVARWLRHQLQERGLLIERGLGGLRLQTTGEAPALARQASLLLGTATTADTVPDAWRGTPSP